MKRFFDLILSSFGLIFLLPILIFTSLIIYLGDFGFPLYVADRVGKNGKIFKIYKLRSMVINADKTGVDSTSANDRRITRVGKFVRKYKLDEFCQLINVIKGEMSLVGPRPNVKRETDLYTNEEKRILSILPGITDIASIVFSDESDILAPFSDPDLAYNQLIRPRKNLLAILYLQNKNLLLDIKLILITVIAILNKPYAIKLLTRVVRKISRGQDILEIVRRIKPLNPMPPPGSSEIVLKR